MSTRAIVRALAFGGIAAAACDDPAEPTLPGVHVTPRQWSGGTIVIRSAYFVERDPLPVLLAGTDTLSLTRRDDSTLATTLPRGPSGSVTVTLARGARRDQLGTVARVGYRDQRTITPALYGELLATDSAGEPFVFGASFTGTGHREPIVKLRLAGGASEILTLRQPSNSQYGMAPTMSPGLFAVRDSTDSLRLAALLQDDPAVVSTVPFFGTAFTRQISLLAPGVWLATWAHRTETILEADTSRPADVMAESPWDVYISPSGGRTTIAAYIPGTAPAEVPVFDNATGAVAYTLPLRNVQAAVFSNGGSVLFVAGSGGSDADTLVAVNAASGALLLPAVALPDGFQAFHIAYRRSDDQLVVAAANPTSMALLIYAAGTLTLEGILPAPDPCGGVGLCLAGVVSLSRLQDAAYLVVPGDPTPIWTFDLLDTP